jgi:alpha/beta superfamily hydrolase
MLNKVAHTLARAMNELGVPAVRFNFRGVGASSGEYGDGLGETDDTLAVANWALDRYAGAGLSLLGFSFGAMVACRAALGLAADSLVTVAPAVSRLAGLLEGRQPDCPWLIVHGDADEVVSCDEVVDWFNTLSPGPELTVLPDASHFFHGRLTILRETVVAFYRRLWGES